MKKITLTYEQSANILQATGKHLADLDGDVMIDVYDLEHALQEGWRSETKLLTKYQKEIQTLNAEKKDDDPLTREEVARLHDIQDKIEKIQEKEKEFEITQLEYGTGTDKDLKKHIKMSAFRWLRPVMITETKKED